MIVIAKNKLLFYFGMFFILIASLDAIQHSTDKPLEIRSCLAEINQEIEEALKIYNIPGAAVGVIVDGKIILSKGYGYRDADLRLPVTKETNFGIGSCTKAFTAFLLGQLVDEKKISWDAPIIKYIPELSLWDHYTTHSVTVRDLLTHRTGFSGHDFLAYNVHIHRNSLAERLNHLEPIDGFRSCYHYSNIMYALAGLLIERVTGVTWEQTIDEKILKPLGMNNSCFLQADSYNNLSASYFFDVKEDSLVLCPSHQITFIAPSYGIKSSVSEMLKWLELNLSGGTLMNKKFIDEETLIEMHTPHISAPIPSLSPVFISHYGLGWRIGSYNEIPLVMHGGTNDGFQTQILLLPSEKMGVIVLTNCTLILNHRIDSQKYFINAVSNIVLDRLLGKQKSDWTRKISEIYEQNTLAISECKEEIKEVKAENFPSNSDDYSGTYDHPGYGNIQINYRDKCLIITYGDITSSLEYYGEDCFMGLEYAFYGKNVWFSRNQLDRVNRLFISLEPSVKPIEFNRKK